MKRVGHLFEQIVAFDNLLRAARQAQRGKRHRHVVARFGFHLEPELLSLQAELIADTYRMQPYHTFQVYEPKPRRICAAAFRDRVVHHAICQVIEPVVEASLIADTYACRRGKGAHAAVQRAQHFARRWPYVLTMDVHKYFDSVDHAVLKTLLRRRFKDKALLALLDGIIDHPIPHTAAGRGLPIGNLTSQYFANLYLGVVDHWIKEVLRVKGYVRYMDDMLVFAADKPCLHETLAALRHFLGQTLKLEIKPSSVRVAPVSQGIAFLGFRVFPHTLRLQHRTLSRLRRRIRQREAAYAQGRLDADGLARSVASMIGHVQHANTLVLRRRLFADSWRFG